MKCLSAPCKVRFHVLRIACAFVCAIGIVLVAFLLFRKTSRGVASQVPTPFRKSLLVKYVKNVGNSSVACRLPNLDPFHESVLKFLEDLGKLHCKGERFSRFENNVLRVEGEGIISAQYRRIGRPSGDDFKVLRSEPVPVQNKADKSTEKAGKHEQYSPGM